jgi:hypothetical protein
MGLELTAHAQVTPTGGKKQSGEVKVLLETDELILRGAIRLKVRRGNVREARAKGGIVTIRSADHIIALTVGDAAGKFVAKLLEAPKSRLDKMGIAAAMRVVVLSVDDDAFHDELAAVGASVTARAGKSEALIVLGVSTAAQLPRVAACATSLAPDGALWVVHPKGVAGVKDTDIFAVAKQSGLTYTKVARFSETHTAEKLVIPKSARVR